MLFCIAIPLYVFGSIGCPRMLYHCPEIGVVIFSTLDGIEVVTNSQVINPFVSWIFSNLLCENGAYRVILPEPGNGTSGLGCVVV